MKRTSMKAYDEFWQVVKDSWGIDPGAQRQMTPHETDFCAAVDDLQTIRVSVKVIDTVTELVEQLGAIVKERKKVADDDGRREG